MKTYHQLVDFASKYKNIVVALGMFDGLHIGHQKIIRTAAEQASRIHGTTFVFSFTNHPRTIVDSLGAPRRISSEQVSLRILRNLGVDVLVEIPFTHDFADTSPEEFIHLLYRHFSPRYIVVGENYTFGKKGAGTPQLLHDMGKRYTIETIVCSSVLYDGEPISSTRIRTYIEQGDITHVNELLGYPFTMIGTVIHGQARGRLLGFPTANIALRESYEILPNGVYAVTVVYHYRIYSAVANIGNNPTFGLCDRRMEVHIMDFDRDLYGKKILVSFHKRIRSETRFDSVEALISQIKSDKECAECVFQETFHLQEKISMVI